MAESMPPNVSMFRDELNRRAYEEDAAAMHELTKKTVRLTEETVRLTEKTVRLTRVSTVVAILALIVAVISLWLR